MLIFEGNRRIPLHTWKEKALSKWAILMKNWAGWKERGGGCVRDFRFPQFSFPAIKSKIREGRRRKKKRIIVGPNITPQKRRLFVTLPPFFGGGAYNTYLTCFVFPICHHASGKARFFLVCSLYICQQINWEGQVGAKLIRGVLYNRRKNIILISKNILWKNVFAFKSNSHISVSMWIF